eukprot:gnl/MRDRNA2_/MRDRNA2_93833_c0_seq1.p1 gnl/MRDRNA2_/MRDRNA2_93833_c0~~gnl/MRDRNA2_/MRDRNA2_93833_c0_seq1.p1  ORF type:complete len:144 (-),score=31.02 gnl/MRDRNA2_/MRDRNA2_93833_c0_seq1:225-656(-)
MPEMGTPCVVPLATALGSCIGCDNLSSLEHQPSPQEQLPATPFTPVRARRQPASSPPPAPKAHRQSLQPALESNDLVMLVEILAKQPELATIRFANGQLPLRFAMDMGCDASIIGVLEHHIQESEGIGSDSELRASSGKFYML